MGIWVTCKCGQQYHLTPEWAGKLALCQKCKSSFVVDPSTTNHLSSSIPSLASPQPDVQVRGPGASPDLEKVDMGRRLFRNLVSVCLQSLGLLIFIAGIVIPTGSSGIGTLICLGIMNVGYYVTVLGRRCATLRAEEAMALEPGLKPILYLRSFTVDQEDELEEKEAKKGRGFFSLSANAREEEVLAEFFGSFGPFIAVGRPGEKVPPLGAARAYFSDSNWQPGVRALMEKSTLVILRAGESKGFLWEVRQVVLELQPTQVLFYFSQRLSEEKLKQVYENFRSATAGVFPVALPQNISTERFLAFQTGWKPVLFGPMSPFKSKSRLVQLTPMIGVPWDTAKLLARFRDALKKQMVDYSVDRIDSKLFGDAAIAFGTLLGGPFACAIMVAKNLFSSGRKWPAFWTAIGIAGLGCLELLVLRGIAPALPAPFNVRPASGMSPEMASLFMFDPVSEMNSCAALVNAFVAYSLWRRYSGRRVRRHMVMGDPRVRLWISIPIILACTLLWGSMTPSVPDSGEDSAPTAVAETSESEQSEVEALLETANAHFRNKELSQAIEGFSEVLKKSPGHSKALGNRAMAYEDSGQLDLAVADFSTLIAADPSNPDYLVNRGSAYFLKKDYGHAIEDCTQAMALKEDLVDAYFNCASAYEAKGERSRAISLMAQAAKMGDSEAQARLLEWQASSR